MKKNDYYLIAYSVFRLFLEITIFMYILGIFHKILLIPTIMSALFTIYYLYQEVLSKSKIKGIKKKKVNLFYVYSIVYSLYVLILGCILLTEGNFANHHAPAFFIISALILFSEILNYFYIEKKEMLNKTRMKMIAYSIICGAIIFSTSIVSAKLIYIHNLPPLRYTQEDIDNAAIAYIDVKINETIGSDEIQMYKTWHYGGDYLTIIFQYDLGSNISCHTINDQDIMAGGSVSISWKGFNGEITTYKMKNEEGWVYFYTYKGLETPVENITTANYSIKVSSEHLNYRYPDLNIPDID
ncbi:MAG: hypothetical protein ACTSWX_11360 [Promethearchaeota archaeon]